MRWPWGTVLASEDFSYGDGALVGNGAWVNHSGTPGDLAVSGGAVTVNSDGSTSEDAHTIFAGSTGTVYFGIDFTVSASAPAAGTDTEYFAHFMADGTFNFRGRLDIVAATGGGDFSVGIASDDSTADAIWATDLSYGTTYRAVVGYDQDTNIATLWIDAASMASTSIVGDDDGGPGDAIDSFALRQSNSDYDETIIVDNLTVATTFDEANTGVPEPGSLALLGLGGLALLRRRR